MTDAKIREFVAAQRELLDLELQAETLEESEASSIINKKKKGGGGGGGGIDNPTRDDNDERKSHILGNLEASEISVGLYGRTVVQLTTTTNNNNNDSGGGGGGGGGDGNSTRLLPAHRFTVGDEVEIRSKQKSKSSFPGGVISAVSDTYVSVALFSSNQNSKTLHQQQSGGNIDNDTDDNEGLGIPPLSLVPRSSVEVNKKMISALQDLERDGVNHPIAGNIIQCMFQVQEMPNPPPPPSSPNTKDEQSTTSIQPFNTNLDSSQLEAIQFALQDDRPIALIHGPPGTGKTTTIAELIHQAVFVKGMKVLCCAPSNVAVDNILERLVAALSKNNNNTQSSKKKQQRKQRQLQQQKLSIKNLRAVRLGHPARIKSSILPYSLEALVQNADGTEIVADVRNELQTFLKILSNPKSKPNDKRIAYREMKSLRKEVRTREEKVVDELINSAQIVLATTVGAANNRILSKIDKHNKNDGGGGFDLVVIDEAAQALEASCWIPILRGRKVVLAGDHCQLPPTIKSNNRRAQVGLGRTMFERLMDMYGDNNDHKKSTTTTDKPPRISRMLKVQYRMHEDIANWASEAMYNGELQTHESVKNQKLSDLDAVRKIKEDSTTRRGGGAEFADTTLLLVDTAGCSMHETVNAAGSRFNNGEANVVALHVRKLLAMGLQQNQLAIITPYNGQVELLRGMLLPDFPNLEIRSVDGFQGGERDAVVLSLVRSSPRGGENGIGFLKDDRRQNVAVTRAKSHLAIICDSETVSKSKFIESLITWIGEHGGEVQSAVEYLSGDLSSDPLYEADNKAAESDLMKLVEASFVNDKNPAATKKTIINDDDAAANATEKQKNEERRKQLMDKISLFAESGKYGDEMALATELTSYDRRLVHEFAEQIGLGHRSEGDDGVDRRLILTITKGKPTINATPKGVSDAEEMKEEAVDEPNSKKFVSSFAALTIDDSESDSDDEDTFEAQPAKVNEAGPIENPSSGNPANSLLGQLAAERAARQKQSTTATAAKPSNNAGGGNKSKKNNKKGKSRKLGGNKKIADAKEKEENYDDLDDMAFLDQQIEKSQNTHGRKIVGSGKSYRTIVNGILNEKPKPPEPPKNARAGAALQSKLKEAQNARTKKVKKKKK